jgi:hypothetical protein
MRQADRNTRYANGAAGLTTWRTQITHKHHLARDEKDLPGFLAPFRLADYPTVVSLASAPESDRYEELLVNPTILTLTRQRGNIDCGGLGYVVVRYGNFFQFVAPIEGGHVSVAFDPDADPIGDAQEVLRTIETHLT